MSSIEIGKCDVCGNESHLHRTYFRYNIKCDCHSPQHFELVCHCFDCVPREPIYTIITVGSSKTKIDTTKLKKLDIIIDGKDYIRTLKLQKIINKNEKQSNIFNMLFHMLYNYIKI